MNANSEESGLETSMLIGFSIGLGSLAVVLAEVAVSLLLQKQGVLTKPRYRTQRSEIEVIEDSLEPSRAGLPGTVVLAHPWGNPEGITDRKGEIS